MSDFAPAEKPAPHTLRLASYNIRKAVGLDWRRDPPRVARVIAALNADVVALQEADRRLGPRHAALSPDLIARETGMRLVPLSRSSVSIGWHGNALLVRDGIEVIGTDLIELPGLEPRGGVAAHLGTPLGEITVAGVHLGLRRACRILQFHRIVEALAARAPRTAIMGDFNEWSPDRGIEALLPHFEVISPGRSYHASRPLACLDRVALGEELALVTAGVQRAQEARRASDHLPIWADVTLAEWRAKG